MLVRTGSNADISLPTTPRSIVRRLLHWRVVCVADLAVVSQHDGHIIGCKQGLSRSISRSKAALQKAAGLANSVQMSRTLSKTALRLQGHCKLTARLSQLKDHARMKGGECLADEYVSMRTKIPWRCSDGHIWYAHASTILHNGSWCPACAGNRPVGLQRLKEHAARKGGACLAESYGNSSIKLPWRCQKGHTWMASATNILHAGSWCPHCSKNAPVGLRRLQQHARRLGGKCLAVAYRNSKQKVVWQCQLGHTWEATSNNILHRRSWCPSCARSSWRTESHVRNLFEDIFCPHTFPSSFPAFLAGLQLDGHCAALNLAFEYHGEQHFEPDAYFNSLAPEQFEKQLERDARKLRLCESFGVRLLVVPYFVRDKRNFVLLSLLRWFRFSEVNRATLPGTSVGL